MALVIGGTMIATALSVPVQHGPAPRAGTHPPGPAQLRALAANRPFMILLGAKVFQYLAFAAMAASGLLYLLNVIGAGYSGQIVLTLSGNVVTALAMPLWVRSGRRLGKRTTYLIGVVLYCTAALSWLTADPDTGAACSGWGPERSS